MHIWTVSPRYYHLILYGLLLLTVIGHVVYSKAAQAGERSKYEYTARESIVGYLLEVRGYPKKECRSQTYLVIGKDKVTSDAAKEGCDHDRGVLSALCLLDGHLYTTVHDLARGVITFEPNRERGIITKEKVKTLGEEIKKILERRATDNISCFVIPKNAKE
jgi:hypothetical protein